MNDPDCVSFLQWALPKMHLCWSGFRKVRKQVCKRLAKRLRELELPDFEAYRDYLAEHTDEWQWLDGDCRISISRCYRDKLVFKQLADTILPALAKEARVRQTGIIQAWSIGCCCGEVPYTLSLLWHHCLTLDHPDINLSILATDSDALLLARARRACYPYSAVRYLPADILASSFIRTYEQFCLKPAYSNRITLVQQDIRLIMPDQLFDLILCRNLAFTYFDDELQQKILSLLAWHLYTHGWLVIGAHERLPNTNHDFTVISEHLGLYQKAVQPDSR